MTIAGTNTGQTTAERTLDALVAHPGATAAELAVAARLGRSTITRHLAALESAGQARRKPGAQSRAGRNPDRWTRRARPLPISKPRHRGRHVRRDPCVPLRRPHDPLRLLDHALRDPLPLQDDWHHLPQPRRSRLQHQLDPAPEVLMHKHVASTVQRLASRAVLLTLLLVISGLAGGGSAEAASRSCGVTSTTAGTGSSVYRARVTAVGVGCATARAITRNSISGHAQKHGWSCSGSGEGGSCVKGTFDQLGDHRRPHLRFRLLNPTD